MSGKSKSRRTTPTRDKIAGQIAAIGRAKARAKGVALLFEYELTWDYDDNFLLPEIGAPGIEYLHRRGPIQGREDVWVTADWLVYRDDVGLLGGILIRFPKTVRDKTGRRVVPAGELTLIVKPDHQRRGVGAALLEDAASRWAVDWAAQRYSARGLELIKSVVDRGMIEARFDVCSLVVTDSGEPVLEFADTIGNEP